MTGAAKQLLLAIPENPERSSALKSRPVNGLEKQPRHVLVIHCEERCASELQKLLSLAAWCLRSLQWMFPAEQVVADKVLNEVSLTAFLARQLVDNPQIYLTLLDELAKRTASVRCYMVCLRSTQKSRCQSRLLAVSGQTNIDSKLPAAKRLCQIVEQVYLEDPMSITLVHEILPDTSELSVNSQGKSERTTARLMVPANVDGKTCVVVLERCGSLPFSLDERKRIGDQLSSAVPVCVACDSDRLRLRSALQRIVQKRLMWLYGWRYKGLCLALASAFSAVFCLVPVEDRISAEFSVESADKHVLIAPGKGYLKAIHATAGDRVSAGQLLAELDDEELLLKKARWQSELQQNKQDLIRALASKDRVAMSSLKEQQNAIYTEISLIQLNQERYRLRAPVDGVVLSGQWHDSLGAALNSGEVLFDIGSGDQHRLVLRVDENRVREIAVGQSVGLRLAADPARTLGAVVTAVMPVAVSIDGESHVNVHALLDGSDVQIRPGMSGVGKILVGRRSIGAQWLDSIQARLTWLGWKTGVLE